jgi:hypothetical protein
MSPASRAKKLGNIKHAKPISDAERIDSGGIHDFIFRTSHDEERNVFKRKRFPNPVFAGPVVDSFVADPDPPAAGPATKGVFPTPRHFDQTISRCCDQSPGGIELAIVAAKVAGIVIRDGAAGARLGLEQALVKHLGEECRMVNDIERRAETLILIPQRVEAVPIGRHDPLERASLDRRDIRPRQRLKKAFLAGTADVVSTVLLGVVQNAKIDSRAVE